MKLAFSAITRGPQQTDRLFASYADAGFDGLQLKGGQYAAFLDEPGRFLDERGGSSGAASALIAGGDLGPDSLASLRRLFAFAAAVGTERVVFCHGVPRAGLTGDDIRSFARALSGLGREAADAGVKLSLHNHYDNPVMHRADVEVFFGAAAPGSIGLTADTAHFARSGVADIAGIVRDFAGVIDNFHLKDYADGQWRVLGEGGIDFAPIFAAIRRIGYDGWVSADEESGAELGAAMRTCYRFMKDGLAGPGGGAR